MKKNIQEKIKNKVCDGCGGKLRVKQFTENSCFTGHKEEKKYWPICKQCSRVYWGVDKKVWKIARELVEKENWRPYSHIETGEEGWLASQTAGAASKVYDVLRIAKIDIEAI